jgi:hypothetical protein
MVVFTISWAISRGLLLDLWEIGKARVRAKSAETLEGSSHCRKEFLHLMLYRSAKFFQFDSKLSKSIFSPILYKEFYNFNFEG